jgi:hypothetical protein
VPRWPSDAISEQHSERSDRTCSRARGIGPGAHHGGPRVRSAAVLHRVLGRRTWSSASVAEERRSTIQQATARLKSNAMSAATRTRISYSICAAFTLREQQSVQPYNARTKLRGGQGRVLAGVRRSAAPSASVKGWAAGGRTPEVHPPRGLHKSVILYKLDVAR